MLYLKIAVYVLLSLPEHLSNWPILCQENFVLCQQCNCVENKVTILLGQEPCYFWMLFGSILWPLIAHKFFLRSVSKQDEVKYPFSDISTRLGQLSDRSGSLSVITCLLHSLAFNSIDLQVKGIKILCSRLVFPD